MSDRFELSFKNKVVRMWLIIMVPTLIAEIFIFLFTEFSKYILFDILDNLFYLALFL